MTQPALAARNAPILGGSNEPSREASAPVNISENTGAADDGEAAVADKQRAGCLTSLGQK
jgi:hypothetical protein